MLEFKYNPINFSNNFPNKNQTYYEARDELSNHLRLKRPLPPMMQPLKLQPRCPQILSSEQRLFNKVLDGHTLMRSSERGESQDGNTSDTISVRVIHRMPLPVDQPNPSKFVRYASIPHPCFVSPLHPPL